MYKVFIQSIFISIFIFKLNFSLQKFHIQILTIFIIFFINLMRNNMQ